MDNFDGINLDALVSAPTNLTAGRTYKQILEDTRRLLSNREQWAQGYFARDSLGQPTKPRDPTARCWCLLGAVAACSNELGITPPPLLRFMEEMMHFTFGEQFDTLGEMNDYITHNLVLDFLTKCIGRFD